MGRKKEKKRGKREGRRKKKRGIDESEVKMGVEGG